MANDIDDGFQFNPTAWLTSPEVRPMTITEEGAYLRLLIHQWLNGSNVPTDHKRLKSILDVQDDEVFERILTKVVGPCFKVRDDDSSKMFNKVMDKQYQEYLESKRQISEARAEAGRRGGEIRAERAATGMTNYVQKRKQEAAQRQAQDPMEQLRVLQEAAGESLTPWSGTLRVEHAEMLSQCTIEELQVLGAHLAAGQFWASRKDGTSGVNLAQVLSKRFESNLADALTWDRGGRKNAKKPHTFRQDPMPAVVNGGLVKL